MARARKLFPIYGSSLANNMLTALDRGHVVAHFVAEYIDEYDRHGIQGGPSRDRELAETIGREVILAMVLEVERALPGFFGKKIQSKLKEEEKDSVQAFFQEWAASLARAWNWNKEDRNHFQRDLALYSEFAARRNTMQMAAKRGKIPQEDSPFVGRVALLLDPSMLEQARRASRKFHVDAERLAQKLLRQTLRPGVR
jgi:hypothetical protein